MTLFYLLSAIYLAAALWLAVYGANSFTLALLYLKVRRRSPRCTAEGPLPSVTVQLPVYNERWVVARLINAVAALDYPRHLLQVQVLDDSTDHTTAIARVVAGRCRRAGLDVEVIHRRSRPGYKAGALAAGLASARGELIAVFDADFVPPADWLRRVVPHFVRDPGLGFAQTRWGHLNGVYSSVTRAQVLALDGHFVVEQTARQRSGLLMNFNGAAGIWRRRCIEDAGGWSARTLCEDLDLSYRAQMRGWGSLYLPDVVAPAEVPPTILSFKRQQRRWATGSVQCLRHLAGSLLRSRLAWWQKLGGLVHISGYLSHPLMLVLLLTSLPLLLRDGGMRFHLAFLGLAGLGPPLVYALSQTVQGNGSWRRLASLPVLVALGTGVALSNTLAVLRALRHDGGEFQRTPKFRLVGANGDWRGKQYSPAIDRTMVAECALALYAVAVIVVAWDKGSVYAIPFMALYACGFGFVGVGGILESRSGARARRRQPALRSRASHTWPG